MADPAITLGQSTGATLGALPAMPPAPNVLSFLPRERAVQQQIQALPSPALPKLQPVPQNVPPPQVTDPIKAMTPGMMILMALAGATTRHGMTGAVTNLTGYLTGIRQGDEQATKYAMDQFNKHFDAAIASNKSTIEEYHAAREKHGDDVQKLYDEMNGIATEKGDTVLQDQLRMGRFDEVFKILDARQRQADALQVHQDTVNLQYKRFQASSLGAPQMVYTKDGRQILAQQDKGGALGSAGQWYTADENHDKVDDVVSAVPTGQAGSPEATASMAHLIASYAVPPLTGYALRSPGGMQTMADVVKINPQYNANNFTMAKDTIDQFSRGQPSQRLTSINTAIQHLQVLQQLADALKSGDTRALNAAQQAFEIQFGQKAPTNFDAVVNIVGQEVVKAVVASGGGVAERREASDAFSRAGSPEQVQGAVESVTKLLAGQAASLRQQYKSRTQNMPGILPFDEFLLPDTIEALKNVGPASQRTAPVVTTQQQFDALPSGATYQGADGATYRKP